MKRLPFFLLTLFLVAGCAEQAESDHDEASHDEAAEHEAGDLQRPDALNPENENFAFPAGWKVVLDTPDPDATVSADTTEPDVYFATMTPGWHVTMQRPRAIFYHPASTAEGSFTASSQIFLFPPGQRNEGYGLIFGGQDLDSENPSYIYFLIRRSGDFLIKRRMGEETETLFGWEANDAVVAYTEETTGTTDNTLGVRVEDSSVSFLINGVEVHSMEKGDLQTDGIVGLRMNHAINAHVASLDVSESD